MWGLKFSTTLVGWLVGFYGKSTHWVILCRKRFYLRTHIIYEQFFYKLKFWSIYPIDGTLTGATTPGQSGPGSNGNEGVLHIPQSSIIGTSPPDAV